MFDKFLCQRIDESLIAIGDFIEWVSYCVDGGWRCHVQRIRTKEGRWFHASFIFCLLGAARRFCLCYDRVCYWHGVF